MWRSLFAAVVVYSYAHPAFDGWRPAALDVPLQSFYREVNQAAADGHKVFATDGARAIRFVGRYISVIDSHLRAREAETTTAGRS
jgi:hypothetical protein